MDEKGIKSILRMVGFVAAVAMWIASIYFSVDGFNITVPHMMWVGVLMGFVITAVELVWNEEGVRVNFTLKIMGALCYAYGIYTNVAGIAHAQGLGTIAAGPEQYIFPAIFGIFLEVGPEPLAIWALSESVAHGDFLGNLFSNVGSRMQGPSQSQFTRADRARQRYMGNEREDDRQPQFSRDNGHRQPVHGGPPPDRRHR